jgi:hypothetical protein
MRLPTNTLISDLLPVTSAHPAARILGTETDPGTQIGVKSSQFANLSP